MRPPHQPGTAHAGSPVRRTRVRVARLTATGLAVGVTIIAATSGGAAAAADAPVSQAQARFITGSVAGNSLDQLVALKGESAQYPGDPGANSGDLTPTILGQTLSLGKALNLPGPGGVSIGAVAQYAKANKDGSALGSSGLIADSGAISVGASQDAPDFATIDLSGLPGAKALTDIVGNIVVHIGAISGQAKQAAFGKKLADPSGSCTGGAKATRVSAADQAGSYTFAGLTIQADSPLLKQIGGLLTTGLGTLFGTLTSTLGSAAGSVTGIPSTTQLASALSVSIPDKGPGKGAITASLANGSVSIDLAKLLTSVGLDLNNLCPNTPLIPYVAGALAKLPTSLLTLFQTLPDKLVSAVSATGAGALLTPITNLLNTGANALVGLAQPVANALSAAGQPLLDALTTDLLNIVVNAQSSSGGTFTETAVQLNLLPGGAKLPGLPTLPKLPALPAGLGGTSGTNPLTGALGALTALLPKDAGARLLTGTPPAAVAPARVAAVRLQPRGTLKLPALAAPVAAASTGRSLVQLNLGAASVAHQRPAATPAAASSAKPAGGAPPTAIPTGIPAGAGATGGSPILPVVLGFLGLAVLGGGVLGLRARGLLGGRGH